MYLKELFSNFLSSITRLIPIKKKYEWHSNKTIIAMSFVYTLITILEIIAFSKIVGWGLDTWRIFIVDGITWIKQLINR